MLLCLTLAAVLTAAAPARAQYVQIQSFEVSPFIGVRMGGTFHVQPEGPTPQVDATLKDATLYRLQLSSDGRSVESTETLFAGEFGRLRAVLVAPDGSIYIGTSNRDGRGTPMPNDDRIIRIRPRG